MARIPLYELSTQLTHLGPGIEHDVNSFGIGAREMGKARAAELLVSAKNWNEAGEFGEKLSKAGLDLDTALRQARQVNDLASMKLDSTQRLYQLREEVKADPDPATWTTKFKTEAENHFQETMKRSSDPGVQAHYKAAWASHFPVMMHGLTVEARKQQIANFAGDVETNFSKSVELYNQAGNDIERAKVQADAFSLLQGGVSAGFLAPAKAQQLREGFTYAVAMGAIDKAKLTDPAGTLAKVKEPGAFGLDDTQRAKLIPGLTANLHRAQEDNALEVQKWYEEKKLTLENLKGMRDARVINMGTYKHFDAALQNDALPVAKELNYDKWAKVHAQSSEGKANPDEIYALLKAGEFGTGAAALDRAGSLLRLNASRGKGETPKEMSFTKDPYFRLAVKEIGDRLKPLNETFEEDLRKGLGKGAARNSPLPSHEAGFLFMEACKEAQAKGELTGPWMWKKAQEIIQPFELMGVKGFKPGAARPAAAAAEKAPTASIPVKNNRTGAIEYVTPAEYDLIIRNQGGRR
jgi:hypothetical protein